MLADSRQLLWGVNITLRRKLTLMLLFSGAVFIMLAGTIRAVTILTVSISSLCTSALQSAHFDLLTVRPRWCRQW
jgi:hypothetical protein